MKKGDLAFFYHSNCKEPGIVGTMEIVEEHSPDCKSHFIFPELWHIGDGGSSRLASLPSSSSPGVHSNNSPVSAHDPKAPYYDPSSKPSDPKWSVVHVEFRSKFAVPIGLKELRAMGTAGEPLENMQMLKQSRLSVSKVSAAEWEYLMKIAEEKAAAADE